MHSNKASETQYFCLKGPSIDTNGLRLNTFTTNIVMKKALTGDANTARWL